MTPEEIRQIVQQEIARNDNSNRFNVNTIPQQKTSVKNTSSTPQTVLPYIGLVLIDGSVNPPAHGAAAGVIPVGWSINHDATGDYIITHNLGTTAYAVVASPIGTTTQVQIAFDKNVTEFSWFDTATKAPTDTPFYFILVTVVNKKATFPLYNLLGV